ncbi:MAG TPA: hypothetical protein VFY73_25570 [Ideonella sp.]|uniref:hypothetical protein n=1 Tax=Ideonella sp. TaxID=1929293 RepID=UPI002E2F29D8|nr:hypothetical protein [Ideonella sp.]HEX5687400.1 hypothetical protein [Ideonella sp.]
MNAPRSTTELQDQETWIQLFAARLTACWPRLDAVDAEHVGDGLSREARWRSIEPTLAAERWMAQVLGPTSMTNTTTSATPSAKTATTSTPTPQTTTSRSYPEVAS